MEDFLNIQKEITKMASGDAKARAMALHNMIKLACISCRLNLTIHEDRLAFVDQDNKKIVAVADFNYTL